MTQATADPIPAKMAGLSLVPVDEYAYRDVGGKALEFNALDTGIVILCDPVDVPVDAVFRLYHRDVLESTIAALYAQVERPRFNLGSGPPGRAD